LAGLTKVKHRIVCLTDERSKRAYGLTLQLREAESLVLD